MPPVEDGTERFMEILDSIRYYSNLPLMPYFLYEDKHILIFCFIFSNVSHGVHRLPKSLIYLLIPGTYILFHLIRILDLSWVDTWLRLWEWDHQYV